MSVTATSDSEATGVLSALIARALGPGIEVRTMAREPSPFVTLFPAEVLTLDLSDGRQMRVFLKHLGPEQSDQPDKQRRDREVLVYEQLLAHRSELPVPRYFGSRWNAATRRHELYLEHVDDWALRYHGLEHWFTAAARLADLHAHFAARAEELRAADFLLTLDQPYFAAWAERAQAAVTQQSCDLGCRIAAVCSAYAPVCDLLASRPATLVHNDLACKNVLADRSSTPARICVIDWELAGVGCGLLDIVHLKYGLDPANDAEMTAIYRQKLRSSNLLPNSDREFSCLLAACELHKTLYRLAHSPEWKLPMETLAQWVTESEKLLQDVLQP
jgi:hypothetical protein